MRQPILINAILYLKNNKLMRIVSVIIFLTLFTKLNGQTNFEKNFNEAANLFDKKDHKGAIDKFSKAISYKEEASSKYKVAESFLYRGYCKYKLNKFKEAHADMAEALKIKPEFLKVYQLQADVFLEEKDHEGNIKNSDAGLKYRPTDRLLLFSKSYSLIMLKRFKEAIEVSRIVLNDDPGAIGAMKQIANCFLRLKQYDSADVYLNAVVKMNPVDIEAFYNLGISMSYQKDYDKARSFIEKAMSLDSTTTFVGYNNLGFFLKVEQGDYKGSLEYFDKAISLKPDFAFAYSNRGYAKLMLGDIKAAFKDVNRSLDLDNTNAYAYKNLGLIHLKDGNKKAACENFHKALSLGYADLYDDEVDKLIKENKCN